MKILNSNTLNERNRNENNRKQKKTPIKPKLNKDSMEHGKMVSFLWEKQEFLRDRYKRNKYGTVILPFVTLARIDAELQPTKRNVLETIKELKKKGMQVGSMDDDLNKITKRKFNNKSEFESLQDLLSEQKDIKSNLEDYINGFSENIKDIFSKFKFSDVINDLEKKNLLWKAVEHFARYTKDLAQIDNHKMGTIYEELIRKANEASHETAGDQFTPRDVINLMVTLIFLPDKNEIIRNPNRIRIIYDPACGTGGMLSQAVHFLEEELSNKLNLGLVGQDINDEAYAMCKSDMMIRGIDPEYIQFGNSLTSEDYFKDLKFDYMLSNPPYGKDWKDFAEEIEKEHKNKNGRYDVGLPRKNDGSLLFLQHMISKMHPKNSNKVSRIAIVFNGSPLFAGEAGSGESEIRKWILDPANDYLETIIALPKDLFYNTGINTYIWILTNSKSQERVGKVQLINSVDMFEKRKRSLGNKRNEITKYIGEIMKIYESFPKESERCKIFKNEEFGYTRIKVNRPLRRNYNFSNERIERVKHEPSFIKLAESTKKGSAQVKEEDEGKKLQEKIIKVLQQQEKTKIYNDCHKFEQELKQIFDNAKIEIKKGVLSSIQHALSEIDESVSPCKTKEGKFVFDSDLLDYENIPFSQDIQIYFEKEVLEYVKDAQYDPKDNTIGYSIPFSRYFYKPKPVRSLEEIDSEIEKLEREISYKLKEITA
jgi:type I restriction enzyme M protein